MIRFFCLGCVLCLASVAEGQIFDGQVSIDNWQRLVNQPVLMRTAKGQYIDDHNFVSLIADKKTKGVKFIELAKGRQELKIKVEDIASLSIGLKDYRLRYHFPTSTWHLIDREEASTKANSRLEKLGEVWTEARTLDENAANNDEARKFANEIVAKINPMRLKLYETDHVLLITDLPPNSANVLLSIFPKMMESVHRVFGVAPGKTLLPSKPVVGAFHDRQFFGEYCVKALDNTNYGDGNTSFRLTDERLGMAAYSKEKDLNLCWEIIWSLTGAVAFKAYSTTDLPNWLQVGFQQYLADKIVPAVARGEKGDREVTSRLISSGTLNGLLDARPVDSKRHPVCKSLVRFIAETNQAAFSQTLIDIKAGISPDESFQVNYGFTREQMVARFGLGYKIPMLKP